MKRRNNLRNRLDIELSKVAALKYGEKDYHRFGLSHN